MAEKTTKKGASVTGELPRRYQDLLHLSLQRRGQSADVSGIASLVPAHYRTYFSTLFGNRSPITERNFTASELEDARKVIKKAHRQGRNYTTYDDYRVLGGGVPPTAVFDVFPMKSLGIRNTLGRFNYKTLPNGRVVIIDNYDFDADFGGRPSKEYESMGLLAKLGTLLKDTFTSEAPIPHRIGAAFMGKGRPVNIDVGNADTLFPKLKKGGNIENTTYYRKIL